MTQQTAQNHAVPGMKVIGQGQSVCFDNAACVQERQGGYIRKGQYRLMLLPLSINAFIKKKFKVAADEKTAGFKVETLTNVQFKGQMVRRNRIPLMLFFVTTRHWLSDPNQKKFAQANPLRM
jgi:hypothetical protein